MNIPKLIFILKKLLIKLISKIPTPVPGTENNNGENPLVGACLKICGELLREIPMREQSFRQIASFSHNDARSYYLYAVVCEVISACTSCMRVEEWIQEAEEERHFGYPKLAPGNETLSGARMSHLVIEGVRDEFEVKFRRLQECLINLICFTGSNEKDYFRLFLASQEFEDVIYANQDIKEFFGHPIENFSSQSNDLLNLCKSLFDSVDNNQCWFLSDRIKFTPNINPKSITSSFRQRFIKAIKLASNGERVVLGPTYKVGYGGSSKSAHALLNETFKDSTLDDLKATVSKIPVICLNVLKRVSEIGNIECSEQNERLLEDIKSGEGLTKEILRITQGNFEIGDLVTTDGSDVAEVLSINCSPYKYKTFKVRYLANPKIQEIKEEWLPPRYIAACLIKKRDIRGLFLNRVAPLIGPEAGEYFETASDVELYDYVKKAVVGMAKMGHLERFFKREQS